MDWLAEWLKEIIAVVLIAVFIELLLPNRAMERYVRFVVSLLILLTLLSPVMKLFSPDAKERLEAAFSNSFEGLGDESVNRSTEAILQQGEELRQKQETEALQWAGEEAARQMKEQIERETGQPVERVSVKLVNKPATSKAGNNGANPLAAEPAISSVEVVMAQAMPEEGGAEHGASGRGPEISVTPVEKIQISVSAEEASGKPAKTAGHDQAVSSAAMAGSDDEASAGTVPEGETGDSLSGEKEQNQQRLAAQIEGLLEQNWGVGKDAVTIVHPQG
ncbi:stage III sporulation protein AF [Paenibacillus macerans]|uniref:stage III sporulation protein AF n=1 Tax=Paenibacillus macerans TaxID=44252 RepID=UPI003D322C2C